MNDESNMSFNAQMIQHFTEVADNIGQLFRGYSACDHTDEVVDEYLNQLDAIVNNANISDIAVFVIRAKRNLSQSESPEESYNLLSACFAEIKDTLYRLKSRFGAPQSNDLFQAGNFCYENGHYYYSATRLQLQKQSEKLLNKFMHAPGYKLTANTIEHIDEYAPGTAANKISRLRRALRRASNKNLINSCTVGTESGYKLLVAD